MPTYDFKCLQCSEEKNKFNIKQSVSEYTGEAICPNCGTKTTCRIYTPVAVHWGLTVAEKIAGTTKQRFEMGKHVKDQRDNRKKNAEPGTREAESNEYWVGGEADKKTFTGPTEKK